MILTYNKNIFYKHKSDLNKYANYSHIHKNHFSEPKSHDYHIQQEPILASRKWFYKYAK